MTAIDRRAMLGAMLSGAAVAATGLVLMPVRAESAPLTMGAGHAMTIEGPVEKTVVVVRRPRRRVRRCWWRGGRRVCRWVWVR